MIEGSCTYEFDPNFCVSVERVSNRRYRVMEVLDDAAYLKPWCVQALGCDIIKTPDGIKMSAKLVNADFLFKFDDHLFYPFAANGWSLKDVLAWQQRRVLRLKAAVKTLMTEM
jgi:hypothetical protein